MMKELDKNMYFGAKPHIIGFAKELRRNMTEAETILWERVNKKQICRMRFRRQHPINKFIADFYCHQVKLVIEIDGEIHKNKKEYDIGRTNELREFGIEVIRFTNEEVINNTGCIIKEIKDIVRSRTQKSPLGDLEGNLESDEEESVKADEI